MAEKKKGDKNEKKAAPKKGGALVEKATKKGGALKAAEPAVKGGEDANSATPAEMGFAKRWKGVAAKK